MRNFTIVGAGSVGSVLGRVLVENGGNVVCIVSRTLKSAKTAGKFLKCRNCSDSLEAIPPSTDLIIIATPHAAVATVAEDIARLTRLKFARLSVCHASGMLTAEVLEPLRRKGATVFSFHPLQTFPRGFAPDKIVPTARGIYYAVDGKPAALKRASALARKLDGSVITIRPEMRAFYHAACVVASNHLTALMAVVETMFNRLGTGQEHYSRVFMPIITATLRNIEASSPASALSGPVARGGVDTVARHFAAVKETAPELLPYFGAMTLETVNLAERKGSIPDESVRGLRRLVQSYSNSQPEEIH